MDLDTTSITPERAQSYADKDGMDFAEGCLLFPDKETSESEEVINGSVLSDTERVNCSQSGHTSPKSRDGNLVEKLHTSARTQALRLRGNKDAESNKNCKPLTYRLFYPQVISIKIEYIPLSVLIVSQCAIRILCLCSTTARHSFE